MKKKVTIIEYGVGNTKSLKMVFNKLDIDAILTSDKDDIINSKYIVLPGVGAFASAMEKIKKFRLDESIKKASENNAYILGICLGAQLLMSTSEEFGKNTGLDLIPGEVKKIIVHEKKNKIKLPHIGWSEIFKSGTLNNNQEKLFSQIDSKDSFYFIHSFVCHVKDNLNELFHTNYQDIKIPAVLGNKNIFGCQFHPEKSGNSGIKLLKNFMNL